MAELNVGDMFEDMAVGVDIRHRGGMEAVPAPKLPPKRLPLDPLDNEAAPPPHNKLDSPEKLRRRLRELREWYKPFLEDHTPPNPQARPRVDLETFDFRFEEPADYTDAQRPYTDAGDWETVRIPDYRGPVGPWAAYYRIRFHADSELFRLGRVWLRFKAVDYTCQVFINGRYIGEQEGLFAPFGFDVTKVLREDGPNTLVVRVENDAPQKGLSSGRPWQGYGGPPKGVGPYSLRGDKVFGGTGQGWDEPDSTLGEPEKRGGWSHCPPGAGIWQGIYLEGRPTTGIDDLFVRPHPEEKAAELWMETWRSDFSRAPTSVELSVHPNNFAGAIYEIGRRELNPAGPKRSVYKLRFRLPGFQWWTLDRPHLYTLRVKLTCDEGGEPATDVQDVVFGMRSFVQDTTGPRKGEFRLNGEPIVLRGTNEMGNLSVPMQHGDREQVIEDLLLGKAAHLNYWRLTQRPVQSEVYDLCDRLGCLFQTDLPMVAFVRHGCVEETARQAGEMERLIRAHPAAAVSSFINEPTPDRRTELIRHRAADRETLEDFFEVCIRYTRMHNPDRVIKCVDGDYDPPPRHGMLDQHAYVCWHEDHGLELGKMHKGELFDVKRGWFCGVGEYGAEGLEPLETMRRHYPASYLPENDDDPTWTPDRIPKCQAWGWHHQWFDQPETIKGWVEATHAFQAWAVRFMHEAWRRRVDVINSTTLHLLINAYPNNWLKALFSVDREPLPAFFALADANTPLAVNLRTDRYALTSGDETDIELWLLNDTPHRPRDLRVVYRIEVAGETSLISGCAVGVDPVSSAFQGTLAWTTPEVTSVTPVKVSATLTDAAERVVHDATLEISLWPQGERDLLAGRDVAVLGREGEAAWRLVEVFGGSPQPWRDDASPELLVCDSPPMAEAARIPLHGYLQRGGAMLALPQPGGETWVVGDERVEIRDSRGHQFVSRQTGHPAVADLDPQHYARWYHPDLDRITHLMHGFLVGDHLTPVTLTGTGLWYSPREMHPATAELAIGDGRVILDQVRALERVDEEPRAAEHLRRMFAHLMWR